MTARTRDADALVISSSPVTRGVMSALEGLKAVVGTGVGYDVIDVPATTELGVIVVNIADLWVRELANHAPALLLAWNRKIITLDRQRGQPRGLCAGGGPPRPLTTTPSDAASAKSRSDVQRRSLAYPRNSSHTSSHAWVVSAKDSTSMRSSLPWNRPAIASAVKDREHRPKP